MRRSSYLLLAMLALDSTCLAAHGQSLYVIAGQIRDQAGYPITQTAVSANNGGATAITKLDGSYEIKVRPHWSGTVQPQHSRYTFNPPNRKYGGVMQNASRQDFVGTHENVVVGGQIKDTKDRPISGVSVNATGSAPVLNVDAQATTDEQGRYRLPIMYHWSGTITPSHPHYTFTPPQRAYTRLNAGQDAQGFTAHPATTAPTVTAIEVATDEDTPVPITLRGQATAKQNITFRIASPPEHGQLSAVSASKEQPVRSAVASYKPTRDYFGRDSFSVVANDGIQDGPPTAITIVIKPVDDPPIAKSTDVDATIGERKPITLEARDPEEDSISYEILSQPSYGKLEGSPPHLTYVSDERIEEIVRPDDIVVDDRIGRESTHSYNAIHRTPTGGRHRAVRSLASAAGSAEPGQTIWIRGGKYGESLAPARSGEPSRPICYRAFGAYDSFTFRCRSGKQESAVATIRLHLTEDATITRRDLDPAIALSNRDYIILDGLKVEGVDRWLHAVNSNHNIIQNCTFLKALNPGGSSKTGLFFQDARFNTIINNVISDSTQDNLSLIHSDQNVVQGNKITRAAHVLWVIKCGNRNIVRGNYFHNERQKIGEVYDCHDVGFDHELFLYDATKRNVIEDNTFALTASSGNHSPFAGIQYAGQNGIIRLNRFYETIGPALDLTLYASEATYNTGNRIYHNVFSRTEFAGICLPPIGRYMWGDNIIKNNVLSNSLFVANDKRWKRFTQVLNGKPVQLFIGGLSGFLLENNCVFGTGPAEFLVTYGIRAAPRGAKPRPLAWWETEHPELFSRNLDVTPGFMDEAGHDFTLRSNSPLIDRGGFLTRAVGSGEGMELPVADTGYFCDGFDIPGQRGDLIQLEGRPTAVRVRHIDYANNVLKLDQIVSWHAGQGVSLPFSGKAPDMGVCEFVQGDNLPPIAGLKVLPDATDPLSVLLSAAASSDSDGRITRYDWDFGDGSRQANGPVSLVHRYPQPGRYRVKLTVSDDASPPATATAELPLAAGKPQLQVEPLTCVIGPTATTATAKIRNAGEGMLAWQVHAEQPWITVQPSRGLLTADQQALSIAIDRKGLRSGEHEATLLIDGGLGGKLEVPVKLIVPRERPHTTIAAGAVWRYFKGTTQPPEQWNSFGFDDSKWLSGATPIGYSSDIKVATQLGDMLGNYVSIYARHDFDVPDTAAVLGIDLGMIYDDGFIAYINGVEVVRSPGIGSPATPMKFNTECAGKHHSDQPETVFRIAPASGLLKQGRNVLAIQLHNSFIRSSAAVMGPRLVLRELQK